MAVMASQRNMYLHGLLNSLDVAYIPEFSNPPRWVNVLVKNYPDMFWGFGSAQTIDTNCDGHDEVIVRGVDAQNSMKLAIADNPKTGHPHINVLKFDDAQAKCQILPDVRMTQLPATKPIEKEVQSSCLKAVHLQTKTCGELNLSFDPLTQSYTINK